MLCVCFQGAIIVHEVYEDGAAAKDGRLWAGDQVLEVRTTTDTQTTTMIIIIIIIIIDPVLIAAAFSSSYKPVLWTVILFCNLQH